MQTMTVTEINQRIEQEKTKLTSDKEALGNIRSERAKLALLGKGGNVSELAKFDKRIDNFVKNIANGPATIEVLEDKLKEEQAAAAQKELDQLLEQQQKVAKDIEKLSQQFIEVLVKANKINQELHAAITAEQGLRQKTGVDVLENYCHGSQMSVAALLELMQSQIAGQHTTPFGTADSNIQIRL